MPKDVNRPGTSSACQESSQSTHCIMLYRGIIVTTPGTIMVARIAPNSACLPRKRYLHSTKPEMALVYTVIAVMATAYSRLLPK